MMKSLLKIDVTTSSAASTQRRREWISLVLPWAGIVLSAILAAALYNDNSDDSAAYEDLYARQLYGDDGYVPPTDDFTPSSSSSTSSSSSFHPEHHHKPVYSEEHPPLFPLTSRDYAGFILAVMGLMVAVCDSNARLLFFPLRRAKFSRGRFFLTDPCLFLFHYFYHVQFFFTCQAGGGIGGGGILVPIYILVMDFSPKHAIPLSNITVFGGAVANTILNMTKRHPLADRPLVDWDLILVMEPLSTCLSNRKRKTLFS